jgi:hypothetical protein
MSLSENLRMAAEAVAYVVRKVTRGSGNQSYSPPDGADCVAYLRGTMPSTDDWIGPLAQRAESIGCGNCGEQAAVAFMFLLSKGVRPLDYMNLYNADGRAVHSFVVLSFVGDGDGTSTWGPDAVICDAWDERQAYPALQIAQNMSLFAAGSSVRSIRREA